MGFKLQNIIAPLQIDSNSKQILMEIARKSSDVDRVYENGNGHKNVVYKGVVKLSMEQIGIVLCVHPKTIQKGINKLIEAELIIKRKIAKKGNHNSYQINFNHPDILKSSDSLHLNNYKSSDSLHSKSSDSLPLNDSKSSDSLPFRLIESYIDDKTSNSIDNFRIDKSINNINSFGNKVTEIPQEIKTLKWFEQIESSYEKSIGNKLTDKSLEDIQLLYDSVIPFLDVYRSNVKGYSPSFKKLEEVLINIYSDPNVSAKFPYLISVLKNTAEEVELVGKGNYFGTSNGGSF